MKRNIKHNILFTSLLIGLVVVFLLNIGFGQVAIPLKEILKSLAGIETDNSTWEYIILNFRLPKAITAILVGIGLSISGLLMQTLFRNPLAGPYVLGLSSGSSLGVAFIIMGASFLPVFLADLFLSSFGIVLASILGSLFVLFLVFIVSKKLKDTMSILIVGLMFSSFTGAIVSVLTYFSSAEQLQKFTFWSMGNLGNLSWLQLLILSISVTIGSITAFVGPIAFVGLAVPHISKLVFQTSNHKTLFFSTMILGAVIMLICDTVSQLPGFDFTLPINAITSILGAPIVIWLLVRKRGIN